MELQLAIEISRIALWNALLIVMAPLLAGMVVGVTIGVLQTATSVQEQTLTFVPKIFSLIVVLIVLGPWMIQRLMGFTLRLWERLIEVGSL